MPVLIVFVSPSLHQNDSLHCGSCCGVPLAGLAPGKSRRIRVEGGLLALAAVQKVAHAICFRALARIWRKRFPTVRSSPFRKVIEIIFN